MGSKRRTIRVVIGLAIMVCSGLFPDQALGSVIRDIRLGLHANHTRVVVDLSGPFVYRLEKRGPKKYQVHLNGADLNSGTRMESRRGGRVALVEALQTNTGVLLKFLLNSPSQVNTYTWSRANRLILEFTPIQAPEPPSSILAHKPSAKTRPEPSPEEEEPREPAPETSPVKDPEPARTAGTDTPQAEEPKAEKPKAEEPIAEEENEKPQEQVKAEQPEKPKSTMGFLMGSQESATPKPGLIKKEKPGTREADPSTGLTPNQQDSGPRTEVTGRIEMPWQESTQATGPDPTLLKDEPPTTLGQTYQIQAQDEPEPPVTTARDDGEPAQVATQPQAGSDVDLNTSREVFASALEHFNEGRYQQALDLFADAEALSPESSIGEKALFYQADSLFKMYKETGFPPFDQVEAGYQKAIGAFPDSTEVSRALLRMGIVNYETGNADKAKGYFNILLTEHPRAKEAVTGRVYLARLYLDQNKPQQGIRLLRQVVSENPDAPEVKMALWYLGRVLFEVGRFVEAHQRLSELHKRWPGYYLEEPMLHYYLGETAFRLDKLDEARKYLYWVTNISPEISNLDLILTRIGETYRLQKNYRQAAVLYTETQRRFPDTDGALISKIRLAETKNQKQGKAPTLDKVFGIEMSPDARKTYQGIMEKYPDRQVAQLAMLKLGALHYQNKNYLEAFHILEDLLTNHPDTEFYRDAAFALRQSFDQRMKQLAAKKATLKLLSFYDGFKDNLPDQLRNKYAPLLGDAYFDLKLYDRAKQFYETAAKANSKNPGIALNLALCYFHLGEYGPAEKAFKAFAKTYPAHGKINMISLYQGQALINLNRPEEAVAPLEKVLTKGRDSRYYLPAVALLAETNMKLKRPKAAVELLAKVLPGISSKAPEKTDLSILLGEALLAAGRAKEAAQVLAKALQDIPLEGRYAGSYYRLGLAYLEAGRMKEAREVLTRVAGASDPFWAKMAGNRLTVADLAVRLSARKEQEDR